MTAAMRGVAALAEGVVRNVAVRTALDVGVVVAVAVEQRARQRDPRQIRMGSQSRFYRAALVVGGECQER